MRITLKEQKEKLSQAKLNRKNVEYYCSSTKTENTNYKSRKCTGKSSSLILIKGCLHEQSKKPAEIKFP